MAYWHALPPNWTKRDYPSFLVERRKLIAKVVRDGFERLGAADYEPTPLAPLIAAPPDDGQDGGEADDDHPDRHDLRQRFWTELLKRANVKTQLHAKVFPGHSGAIGTGSGIRGLSFNYTVCKHEGAVEMYIDRGKEGAEFNKSIFDTLAASREAIQEEFGEPLEWQRLDTKRACRITKIITRGGYRDESKWESIHDGMIDAMIRLEKALRTHLKNLHL
jgi:hypothetical protein